MFMHSDEFNRTELTLPLMAAVLHSHQMHTHSALKVESNRWLPGRRDNICKCYIFIVVYKMNKHSFLSSVMFCVFRSELNR